MTEVWHIKIFVEYVVLASAVDVRAFKFGVTLDDVVLFFFGSCDDDLVNPVRRRDSTHVVFQNVVTVKREHHFAGQTRRTHTRLYTGYRLHVVLNETSLRKLCVRTPDSAHPSTISLAASDIFQLKWIIDSRSAIPLPLPGSVRHQVPVEGRYSA